MKMVKVFDQHFQRKDYKISHRINFRECKDVPIPFGFEMIPPEEMKDEWQENQFRWNLSFGFWMERFPNEIYHHVRPYIRKLTLCPCGQHDIKNNDIYSSHKEFLEEKGVE